MDTKGERRLDLRIALVELLTHPAFAGPLRLLIDPNVALGRQHHFGGCVSGGLGDYRERMCRREVGTYFRIVVA